MMNLQILIWWWVHYCLLAVGFSTIYLYIPLCSSFIEFVDCSVGVPTENLLLIFWIFVRNIFSSLAWQLLYVVATSCFEVLPEASLFLSILFCCKLSLVFIYHSWLTCNKIIYNWDDLTEDNSLVLVNNCRDLIIWFLLEQQHVLASNTLP